MLKIWTKLEIRPTPFVTAYFILCIVLAYAAIKNINLTNSKSCIIFAVENNRKQE